MFIIITLYLYVYVSLSLLNKIDDFHEKLESNTIPHLNSYNQLQHEDECVVCERGVKLLCSIRKCLKNVNQRHV